MANLQRSDGRRVLITVAAVVVVLAGMREAGPILVPVLLAAFIAILTAPPVRWLEQHRVPTWLAVTLVLLGVLGLMAVLGLLLATSIPNFIGQLPDYRARLDQAIAELGAWVDGLGLGLGTDLREQGLLAAIDTSLITDYTAATLAAMGELVSDTLFVLLTLGFMLAEASGLPRKLRAALGPNSDLRASVDVIHHIQHYLWIHTVISLGNGVCAALLCWALGIPYPILWGVVAFLLNYIPNIGSFLAAIPPTILALMNYGWIRVILVVAGYSVMNMVLDNIIQPKVLGKRLGLSALVVFLSMVFWGWVLGPVGMFLSVPLTMVVKMLLESSADGRGVAVLLASQAEVEDRFAPDDERDDEDGRGRGPPLDPDPRDRRFRDAGRLRRWYLRGPWRR